ncbi:hypothetical protein [Rhizobium halophytocola]|uniref:Phytanoyl-CoA dioxygenase n=1 Tax=Rhizobium halophytocola TaxID=735519 RepID=A0ABS4E3R4_9HYPH|nr:hypothetical protein [Rhizobium halophytocola]MBP1852557.1 hypothetical protein [Rhizobium halophytocola]
MAGTHKDLEAAARNGSQIQRIRARIPTYLKDLRENPAWLPMFVLARTMPGRRLHWLASKRYAGQGDGAPSMFGDVDARAAADSLRKDGIFTGLDLPAGIHEGISAFAACTPCFGNFDRRLEFLPGEHDAAEKRFDRAILSGHYFDRSIECPQVLSVQRDPRLGEIAAHYLGAQARLITTRVWWSFPTAAASEKDMSQASFKYHFDLDDWRMLKFFFYILPADEGTGPHVFVRGSHKRRALRHQLTLMVGHPADEVLGVYGQDSEIKITGPAGTGFVEDPFGFHMGTVPTQRPRLMMEVGFGVSPPSKRRFHGEPVVR